MNIGTETYVMLQELIESVEVPDFLTGFFQSPKKNYHNQSKVAIDKSGDREVVAIPVDGIGSGYNRNESTATTTTEVTPPVYKEMESLGITDVMNRGFGVDPFQDANFQKNAMEIAMRIAGKLTKKIQRATELQASQILTAGQLNLIDASAGVRFALDYGINPALVNVAATVPWTTTATANPLGDILARCDALRLGGADSYGLLLDGESYEAAMRVDSFFTRFAAAGQNVGKLNPHTNPGTRKGSFRGVLHVGDFALDVYTYGAIYENALGAQVKYLPRSTAVILTHGRRDATFGGIPRFTNEKALSWLPNRIPMPGKNMDINFNTWLSEDKETLNIGVSGRPLLIPTSKFSFSSLNTRLA